MIQNILILGHHHKTVVACRHLSAQGHCVYVIQRRYLVDTKDGFEDDTSFDITKFNGDWLPELMLWSSECENDVVDRRKLWPLHLKEIAISDLLVYIEPSLASIELDQIISFTEHNYWLDFEHKLSDLHNLNNNMSDDTRKFCSTKSIQDSIWKRLGIPTIPNDSNKVIVKFDGIGGGDQFLVVNKSKEHILDPDKIREDGKYLTLANEWSNFVIQDYVDIDYQISCHFYCNDNTWYHLNTHVMYYEDNCPVESNTSYIIQDADNKIITDSIKKLSKELSIPNRLVGWQFVKTKDGKLYSTDFNARPFGGYDAGSYDTDVSDQNWIDYLMGETPPEAIKYTHEITCKYIDKQQFGYSGFERFKNKLDLKYEVTKYD